MRRAYRRRSLMRRYCVALDHQSRLHAPNNTMQICSTRETLELANRNWKIFVFFECVCVCSYYVLSTSFVRISRQTHWWIKSVLRTNEREPSTRLCWINDVENYEYCWGISIESAVTHSVERRNCELYLLCGIGEQYLLLWIWILMQHISHRRRHRRRRRYSLIGCSNVHVQSCVSLLLLRYNGIGLTMFQHPSFILHMRCVYERDVRLWVCAWGRRRRHAKHIYIYIQRVLISMQFKCTDIIFTTSNYHIYNGKRSH